MSQTKNIVVLSAYHDYRTSKRASIHQVARGMVELGHTVTFISTRFSQLSKRKGDSRLFLWNQANRFETLDGVSSYLWRTAFHPFASGNPVLNAAMSALYPLYARLPNKDIDAALARADYVIIESSVAAILLPRVRRLNSACKIIYYATDRLDTVGAHPFVHRELVRNAKLIDHICLRSPRMVSDFAWASDRLYRVEFGIDPSDFADIGPSPYPGNLNAVAVGSMLFDPTFFQKAAPAFPDITFHVIGCGTTFDAPANVVIHPEMKFRETLPFIKHASIGVAPYHPAPGVEYLADSSLKLAQYEYLGLPAVCPDFAVGNNPTRKGYVPGDTASICAAVSEALGMLGQVPAREFQTWPDVAARVLNPKEFADTVIPDTLLS